MTAGAVAVSPGRTSAALAAGAGAVAAVLLGTGVPLLVGLLGTALVGAGSLRGSHSAVDYGAALLCFGVLVAGVYGWPLLRVVPATLCALFAWDVGRYGPALRRQMGTAAETVRAELVHAALTAAVGAAGAVLAYGAFRATAGGQPAAALALLFLGAVVTVAAVR